MLKQTNISHRQAEESAGTKQQFDSPQTELAWLKANRQDLKGFVRVLEIIDEQQRAPQCPFIEINQLAGELNSQWLAAHRDDCVACVGALLCWFFGADHDADWGNWRYEKGFYLLQRQTMPGYGIPIDSIAVGHDDLEELPVVRELAGIIGFGEHNRDNVFNGADWPMPHLDVFRVLAAAHPGK